MQQAGVSSFKLLCQQAGVSRWQLTQLRKGEIRQIRLDTLLKLTQVLHVSLSDLVTTFAPQPMAGLGVQQSCLASQASNSVHTLRLEYERLEQQLLQQRHRLWQEFQQATVQTLESLLLQWPTAAHAARQNPQAPAVRLLPLLRPMEQLLQAWGVEAIGPVGAQVNYDPQVHQLMEGTAQPGDLVKIRYVGYRQGDKLLYRAKTSPVPETT